MTLRSGVSLIQGREHQGSTWYLRDNYQDKEWNISAKLAAWLRDQTISIDPQTVEAYKQELGKLKVLAGQDIPAGPRGVNAQHLISQKLTLLKPDDWLKKHPKMVAAPFMPVAFVLLALLTVLAGFTVHGQWAAFYQYQDTYLDSTVAIIIALAITKALHEFGHAFAISHSKGKVNAMGIALIAGMPLPKTDASLLAHAPKKALIKIAIAGIYFELWAAVLATILWGGAEDGVMRSALHSVAVISLGITLAANALPLMKFDGYYLISAVMAEPRLYEEAIGIFRQNVFALLGKQGPDTVRHTGMAKLARGLYGAAIFGWKVFLPFGIMLALRMFFPESNIGYIAGALPIYPMWIKPGIAEIKKLSSAPKTRWATMSRLITATITLALFGWLFLPMNHVQNAPGAITRDRVEIKTQTQGTVVAVRAKGPIKKGEQIAQIAASNQALLGLSELHEKDQIIETQLSSGTVTENINVLSTQRSGVAAEKILIEQQVGQGIIIATEDGYYQPSLEPGTVKTGTTLGYLYPASGTGHLSVFVKSIQGLTNNLQALLLLPNGSTQKVSLFASLSHSTGTTIPDWMEELRGDNLALYKSQTAFSDLPEMPVEVIYKRRYSLAGEWLNRYITRIRY